MPVVAAALAGLTRFRLGQEVVNCVGHRLHHLATRRATSRLQCSPARHMAVTLLAMLERFMSTRLPHFIATVSCAAELAWNTQMKDLGGKTAANVWTQFANVRVLRTDSFRKN